MKHIKSDNESYWSPAYGYKYSVGLSLFIDEYIVALEDVFGLYNIGLVGGNGNVILEMPYIVPLDIRVQGMGAILYNLMELATMPYAELQDLIDVLR